MPVQQTVVVCSSPKGVDFFHLFIQKVGEMIILHPSSSNPHPSSSFITLRYPLSLHHLSSSFRSSMPPTPYHQSKHRRFLSNNIQNLLLKDKSCSPPACFQFWKQLSVNGYVWCFLVILGFASRPAQTKRLMQKNHSPSKNRGQYRTRTETMDSYFREIPQH